MARGRAGNRAPVMMRDRSRSQNPRAESTPRRVREAGTHGQCKRRLPQKVASTQCLVVVDLRIGVMPGLDGFIHEPPRRARMLDGTARQHESIPGWAGLTLAKSILKVIAFSIHWETAFSLCYACSISIAMAVRRAGKAA